MESFKSETPRLIPKHLHFVWIGDESKCPHNCIDSWRRLNPDYQITIWGNHELENNDWVFKEQMQRIWETGQLYGVADLMRWEILYQHGGIALDADSLCIHPIPEWILKCTAFACWQNEIAKPGLISNGYVGTHPGDRLISTIIDTLRNEEDLAYRQKWLGLKKKRRTSWKTTGPQIISDCYRKIGYENLTVLPSHFFIPHDHLGKNYTGSGPVIALQLFGSTRDGKISHETISSLTTEQIISQYQKND